MKRFASDCKQSTNYPQSWPVLDLSSNSKREEDMSILDLSRKMHAKSTTNITKPQMITYLPKPSAVHASEQYQQPYLSEEDRLKFLASINVERTLPLKEADLSHRMYEFLYNTHKTNNRVNNILYGNGLSLYMNTAPLPSGGSMKIPTVLPPTSPMSISPMSMSPISTSPISVAPSIYTETLPSLRNILCNQNIPPLPVAFPMSPAETEQSASPIHNVKKATRPFKAYPKDLVTTIMTDYNSNERYLKYRETMLRTYKKENKDAPNPKMRRVSKDPVSPTSTVDEKDAAYWERRKKNNEAAKRSRDARRAKEDELAIKVVYLEGENLLLKKEIAKLMGIPLEEVNRTVCQV